MGRGRLGIESVGSLRCGAGIRKTGGHSAMKKGWFVSKGLIYFLSIMNSTVCVGQK